MFDFDIKIVNKGVIWIVIYEKVVKFDRMIVDIDENVLVVKVIVVDFD